MITGAIPVAEIPEVEAMSSYSPVKALAYTRPRNSQLSDNVASYVRDLIMSGEVKGGEYLRVERIAADMEVSVTPVREALAVLRGEGFVDQEPRKGFVVVPLHERDVQDLFDEQARISGELARRAVKALDANGVAGLAKLQERLEKASSEGRSEDVEQLNFEFHRVINTASRSHKLEWILRTVMRYSPRRRFPSIEGWDEANVDEHHGIIAAFQAGDEEAVRALMEAHVRHAGDLLVDFLRARDVFVHD